MRLPLYFVRADEPLDVERSRNVKNVSVETFRLLCPSQKGICYRRVPLYFVTALREDSFTAFVGALSAPRMTGCCISYVLCVQQMSNQSQLQVAALYVVLNLISGDDDGTLMFHA